LLLLAVYLFGLAALAVLPPFEAFDEAQYWSAVQQLADTGALARYGEARVSVDAEQYPGPLPASAGQPYATYFAGRSAPLAGGPGRFRPGAALNYEAQHPPAYFLLMAPVFRMAEGLAWPAHFFILRLFNWTLAFFGFCLGGLATQDALRRRGYGLEAMLLPAAWPLLFPQFFEEFIRVTNDTLCLALTGLVWWLVLAHLQHGARRWRSGLLGLVLGLGLLTKAFFLPFGLGVCVLLAITGGGVAAPVIGVAVGGWWYVHALLATGHVTGASDFIELSQNGGFWHSLAMHFPALTWRVPALYLAGLIRMGLGFCWAGSWSFVHPSRVLEVPVLALALLAAGLGVSRRDFVALAPVFLVVPVLAGLLFHLGVMLAGTGQGGGTPGWFLHIFAGPTSLVLALGWRRWMWPLVVYALVLDVLLAWCQLAFFSGCLPRAGLSAVQPWRAVCFVNSGHLAVLGFPAVAGLSAALGVAALVGVLLVVKPGRRACLSNH